MTFRQYIDSRRVAESKSLSALLIEFGQATGVSFTTIKSLYYGAKLTKYALAKACETATGGQVTVKEFCE